MGRVLGIAWVVWALALLQPSGAQAAEPKTLKIVVLGVTGGEGFTQKQLGTIEELLLDSMHRAPAMDVIGRADLGSILAAEQQKELLGCSDDSSCVAEIGGAIGADLIAQGDVGRLGKITVVSLKIIDTKQAKVLARASRKVSDDSELPDAVDELTSEVIAVTRGEPPPAPKAKKKSDEEPASGMVLRLMPSFSTHVYLSDSAASTVGGGLQAAMSWGSFVLVPSVRYGKILGATTVDAAPGGSETSTRSEWDVAVEAGFFVDSKTAMSLLSTVAPGVKPGSEGGPSTKVGLVAGPAITIGAHAIPSLRGRLLVLVDLSRLFVHAAIGGDYEFTGTRTPVPLDLGLGWRF